MIQIRHKQAVLSLRSLWVTSELNAMPSLWLSMQLSGSALLVGGDTGVDACHTCVLCIGWSTEDSARS